MKSPTLLAIGLLSGAALAQTPVDSALALKRFAVPGERESKPGSKAWGFMDGHGDLHVKYEHPKGTPQSTPKPSELPRFYGDWVDFYNRARTTYYFVDRDGNELAVDPDFQIKQLKTRFRPDRAVVKFAYRGTRTDIPESGWGLLNLDGTFTVPEVDGVVRGYSEQRLLVRTTTPSGAAWRLMKESADTGQWVSLTHSSFEFASIFRRGRARVAVFDESKRRNSYGLVDLEGAPILTPRFETVENDSDNELIPCRLDEHGTWAYYGLDDKKKLPPPGDEVQGYADVTGFSDGLALVKFGGRWHAIDTDGVVQTSDDGESWPILEDAKEVNAFSDGFALIKNDDGYVFVDPTGQPRWSTGADVAQVRPYADSMAAVVRKDKSVVYLNRDQELVSPRQ